jgi:hypothetical protein
VRWGYIQHRVLTSLKDEDGTDIDSMVISLAFSIRHGPHRKQNNGRWGYRQQQSVLTSLTKPSNTSASERESS